MSSQVIESFMVQLGYKVDEASKRRFEEGMTRAAGLFANLAKSAAVTAVGVGVAIHQAAKRLDDLYVSSKRVGASAGGIEALKFAVRQLGGTAEGAMSSLERFAQFLRKTGDGGEQKLRGLGIRTRDANGRLRDTVEIYRDLAQVLKSMKSYEAAPNAALFGIDDQTLQAIRGGDLGRFMDEHARVSKEAGVDWNEAAANAKAYSEMIRDLEMRFKALTTVVASKALPTIRGFTNELVSNLDKFTTWLRTHKLIDFTGNISQAPPPKERPRNWFDSVLPESWVSYLTTGSASVPVARPHLRRSGQVVDEGGRPVGAASSSGGPSAANLFQNLERQYGLPAGLLDRIWAAESGRGRFMLSPKGAMGHFQFMPGTAKEFGLKNPNDLGQSASAAARYLQQLMNMFGGDIERAVAAYNWGPGNVSRRGLGSAPAETRDYLRKVLGAEAGAGRGFTQQNTITINVSGAGDPTEVARQVGIEQRSALQGVTREAAGVVR